MNKNASLGDLSLYRTELMGFSALLILLCHSSAYIDMPSILAYILSAANIGVDLFLFLSGMGLWFSLSKFSRDSFSGGGIFHWYIDRYVKLFVPYLLSIIFVIISREMIGNPPAHGFWDYVLYITSFRFYLSHDAPWFIAVIIPLYLLTPVFFFLIKKFRWYAATIVIFMMWAVLFIDEQSSSDLRNGILENVQFVSVRATSFVFGMALGQSVKSKCHIRLRWLIVLASLGAIVLLLSRHLVYGYFFFTLPVLCLMTCVLKYCNVLLVSFIRFMGTISLESYILNGSLPFIMIKLFAVIGISFQNNLLPYMAACVVGTALGWFIRIFSSIILKSNIFHIPNENTD